MRNMIIRLKPWLENGGKHIAIDFSICPETISLIRDLGAELSPMSGYWLIPASKSNYHNLRSHLGDLYKILNYGVWPFKEQSALRNQNKPKALPWAEVTELISRSRTSKDQLMLSLMAYSGLRAYEVVSILRKDLRNDKCNLRIKAQRGNPERVVPLTEEVSSLISEYLEEYRPAVWLFEGSVRGHQSIRGIKYIMNKSLKQMGVRKEVSGSTLRNSFQVRLLTQGWDPPTVDLVTGAGFSRPEPAARSLLRF